MDSALPPLLDKAVEELHRLPGIGRKTALRLALFLLGQEEDLSIRLGESLIHLRQDIRFCKHCHNISESEICPICASPQRNLRLLCIVSDIRDILAIESTQVYNGRYHVLGGLISPMDGISPSQLHLADLPQRVMDEAIEEVILALPATPDGDTTAFYISRLLQTSGVKLSTLAKGIAVGDDLEYIDELTLGRSIQQRTPFN
ncbi:MAG: recombination mediator RecR [Bacteroidales bacterium]|nr:recombination mediator RecR [Bacteroidales bacterium]